MQSVFVPGPMIVECGGKVRSDMSDLNDQLAFLKEIDRLKTIVRASPLIDQSRRENSAEHSWHLAMYALILAEYADDTIDLTRVIKMLLIHDIVEIDAGDTPIHGDAGHEDQESRERAAAERIFGLLPSNQGSELCELWIEFESAQTADAKFAKSLDRLQPLIHNVSTDGGTWKDHNVTQADVSVHYGKTIKTGSAALRELADRLVKEHFKSSASVVTFRILTSDDQEQLWNWLHIALWDPPPAGLRPQEVLQDPGVRIHVEHWGRSGDVGVVAVLDGKDIGACWMRLLPAGVGLASVDDHTPQLGIALLPEHQRQGYGTHLMHAALAAAQSAGYRQVSLTVHPENPAIVLYEQCGFEKRGFRNTYQLMIRTEPSNSKR